MLSFKLARILIIMPNWAVFEVCLKLMKKDFYVMNKPQLPIKGNQPLKSLFSSLNSSVCAERRKRYQKHKSIRCFRSHQSL